MKKTTLYLIIILSVLMILGIFSMKNGKIGVTGIMAYSSVWQACASIIYGPNLVNAMDAANAACAAVALGPPIDSYADNTAWLGYSIAPTPIPLFGGNNLAALYNPGGMFGINYLKVTWTGTAQGSVQKIYLPGDKFENVGSIPTDTLNSRTDWTMYEYIRFNLYCNEYGNGFGSVDNLSQRATLYDGSLTVTVGPVLFRSQWDESFMFHVTASLNYLMNSYDRTNTWNAGYFKVSSVARFYIDAPSAPYDLFTNGQFHVYYDYLTLGARGKVPTYGGFSNADAGAVVRTARGPRPVEGANIQWPLQALNPMPTLTPGMPITGYHVFRSENYAGVTVSGHPYYSIGIFPNNVTNVVDTTCPGGNTYCYKVLILNNGPKLNSDEQRLNTINATYHEALLDEVGQICGWVDVVPSPTPTPTQTWDMSVSPPTTTPTPTNTPFDSGIQDAHVYPNPFNPMAGSQTFYVNNVQIGTKVKIFAMDGALVKVMEETNTPGRFEWKGTNNNGTKVVSGLYYLVLEYDGETAVKRVIVCYKCDPVYKP